MTEPTDTPAPARRAGRPRPQETIDRDARVYAMLGPGPLSKPEIQAQLGEPKVKTMLSLNRLRAQGLVKYVHEEKKWIQT